MAVRLEATIKRYIGLSSDLKPLPGETGETLPAGSSFLESDTGQVLRFDGSHWAPSPHPEADTALLAGVYAEAIRTRELLELIAEKL